MEEVAQHHSTPIQSSIWVLLLVALAGSIVGLPSEKQDTLHTLIRIENQRFKVSSPVQLPCVVQGSDSSVEVNWFKDDQLIVSDERRSILGNLSLNVVSADMNDSGWYTCKAEGSSSIATSSVFITVTDEKENESCAYIRSLLNESIGIHLQEISNAFMLLPMMLSDFSEKKSAFGNTKKEALEQESESTHTCPPGPPGPPGPTGPPGLIGLDGLPGFPGEPGLLCEDTDNIADSNVKCSSGPSKLPGTKGPKGDTGTPGLPGYPGIPGRKGVPGFPGRQGIPGPLGKAGENNRDEKQGSPGPPGPPGLPGPPGIGIQGPSGQKGETGLTGVSGLTSVQGLAPILDLNGLKGEKGAPSESCGEACSPGIPGLPGKDGEKGFSGEPGLHGFPGMKGVKGERGEPATIIL